VPQTVSVYTCTLLHCQFLMAAVGCKTHRCATVRFSRSEIAILIKISHGNYGIDTNDTNACGALPPKCQRYLYVLYRSIYVHQFNPRPPAWYAREACGAGGRACVQRVLACRLRSGAMSMAHHACCSSPSRSSERCVCWTVQYWYSRTVSVCTQDDARPMTAQAIPSPTFPSILLCLSSGSSDLPKSSSLS